MAVKERGGDYCECLNRDLIDELRWALRVYATSNDYGKVAKKALADTNFVDRVRTHGTFLCGE